LSHAVNDEALNILFRNARTHNKWLDKPVTPQMLMAVYDLMRWAPTSANTNPARFVFITSKDAKQRLKPFLSGSNQEKTMAAPACVIVATDTEFAEQIPKLFPHKPEMKNVFKDVKHAEVTAFRNGTLQGAYFIIAARALGLDCGPMSGFDNAGLDKEFFPDGKWKSNFLCNIGYGDESAIMPRNPRLSFDEACKII
jgi:3-hydroxypropanoate dehydrogenase